MLIGVKLTSLGSCENSLSSCSCGLQALLHVNWSKIDFFDYIFKVKERRRIKKAGGFISFNGVWRVAGILATSRALGDYPLKERNLVIAEPDVLTFDLDVLQPKFMILATDGLWDAFSNEEAVAYIKERLDEPHFGAKSIVLQAYYRGSLGQHHCYGRKLCKSNCCKSFVT